MTSAITPLDWLIRWVSQPLTRTLSAGEAALGVPVVLAACLSGPLFLRYLLLWLRRRRRGGNGLTLVSRANARREGYRLMRLAMWSAAAVALALDSPYRVLLFVAAVIFYGVTELTNTVLDWLHDRHMTGYLSKNPLPRPRPPKGDTP